MRSTTALTGILSIDCCLSARGFPADGSRFQSSGFRCARCVQPCEIQMRPHPRPLTAVSRSRGNSGLASARDDAQKLSTMASSQQRGELALCLACSGRPHQRRAPACAPRRLPLTLPASRTSVLRAVFLQKWLRVHMERDPIVLFSCTLGLFGKHLRAACSRSRARLSRPALLRQPLSIALAADRAHFASPCVRL